MWHVVWSVILGAHGELWKNCWTDLDAVWWSDSRGSKKLCTRWGRYRTNSFTAAGVTSQQCGLSVCKIRSEQGLRVMMMLLRLAVWRCGCSQLVQLVLLSTSPRDTQSLVLVGLLFLPLIIILHAVTGRLSPDLQSKHDTYVPHHDHGLLSSQLTSVLQHQASHKLSCNFLAVTHPFFPAHSAAAIWNSLLFLLVTLTINSSKNHLSPVVRTLDLQNGCKFDPWPPHYPSVDTGMGDRLPAAISSRYVTSHPG